LGEIVQDIEKNYDFDLKDEFLKFIEKYEKRFLELKINNQESIYIKIIP